MKITASQIPGIKLSPELEKALEKSSAKSADGGSFGDMLQNKLEQVNVAQQTADVAITNFATGKSRNLHEAILALEMADTSLRTLVTVRNKAIEAYQEIMRMPI